MCGRAKGVKVIGENFGNTDSASICQQHSGLERIISPINDTLFPAGGVSTMEHENVSGMKYILPLSTSKAVQNL